MTTRVRIAPAPGPAAPMASAPYLAWLPLELLARLPGRPLAPLPLAFGRRRCPDGLVLRRSAESPAPLRAPRDIIRETAARTATPRWRPTPVRYQVTGTPWSITHSNSR